MKNLRALGRKLRKKWDNRYRGVAKQHHIGTLDKIIAQRILSKWYKFKKSAAGSVANISKQRSEDVSDPRHFNRRRSTGDSPGKPPLAEKPKRLKDDEYSLGYDEEGSKARLAPLNTNYFESAREIMGDGPQTTTQRELPNIQNNFIPDNFGKIATLDDVSEEERKYEAEELKVEERPGDFQVFVSDSFIFRNPRTSSMTRT